MGTGSTLKKSHFQKDCVGVARSDVIGCTNGEATASVKFIFISHSCRAQEPCKNNTKMSRM